MADSKRRRELVASPRKKESKASQVTVPTEFQDKSSLKTGNNIQSVVDTVKSPTRSPLQKRPRTQYLRLPSQDVSENTSVQNDHDNGDSAPAKAKVRYHLRGSRAEQDHASAVYIGQQDDAKFSEPDDVVDDLKGNVKTELSIRTKSTASRKENSGARTRNWPEDLPPMSDPREMIRDLVERAMTAHGFRDALEYLKSSVGPLRVATMCSGTEAPLIAFKLMNEALGVDAFEFEHLFSAEINPIVQAYILRNFNPGVLFRDVCDLADSEDGKAETAYGGRLPIPGLVDLLIVGSACVDFSPLNNKKKKISDGGESGRTLLAVLRFVAKHRPKMLILENVRDAPWSEMCRRLLEIDYQAVHKKVDTKMYYLPQTRQRGYLLAFDTIPLKSSSQGIDKLLTSWEAMMGALERPASSTYSDFLVSSEDPEIQRFTAHLTSKRIIRNEDWTLCEMRNNTVRQLLNLGSSRPFTNWREGELHIRPPEHFLQEWLTMRATERVKDCIDIYGLRHAHIKHGGFDIQYKSCTVDLSQNADRFPKNPALRIVPCLTPRGMLFNTYHGRPILPIESLRLQGIPRDMMHLTTESAEDLHELAGNAMSVPVVGAAIIAALTVGIRTLDPFNVQCSKQEQIVLPSIADADLREDLKKLEGVTVKIGSTRSLEEFNDMLDGASASARLCICESFLQNSRSEILICRQCQHTCCLKCCGNPTHDFREDRLEPHSRIRPKDFLQKWRHFFPAILRVNISGFLNALDFEVAACNHSLGSYRNSLELAFSEDLMISDFKRPKEWIVEYKSQSAKLELVLDRKSPKCRLFVVPDSKLPTNADEREIFKLPVAKAPLDTGFFTGGKMKWQWSLPVVQNFKVQVSSCGEVSPSWFASLGLKDYQEHKLPRELYVSVPKIVVKELETVKADSDKDMKTLQELDHAITGKYRLLPNCGTSCSSLYKKSKAADGSCIYLFHDPDPIGDPDMDSFVFAFSHDRLKVGYRRATVASLNAKWRSWQISPWEQQEVSGKVHGINLSYFGADVISFPNAEVSLCLPPRDRSWRGTVALPNCKDACGVIGFAIANVSSAVTARYRLPETAVHVGPDTAKVKFFPGMSCVDEQDQVFMSNFGWALRQACAIWSMFSKAQLAGSLGRWSDISFSIDSKPCSICAPNRPQMRWEYVEKSENNGRGNKKWLLVPKEHPEEATHYERAMRSRPSSAHFRIGIDATNTAHIWVELNVSSLAHRAIKSLGKHEGVRVDYRLISDYIPSTHTPFDQFKLRSNSAYPEAEQPPRMLHPLRKEQLRSLRWMKDQEVYESTTFTEQAIEEAQIPGLNWKLEVRAQVDANMRGGILADEVSFGKTITSLALVHSEFEHLGPRGILMQMGAQPITARISLPATLIVCSPVLTKQWQSEIKKFFDCYEGSVVVIDSAANLMTRKIKSLQNAKIVIVNWHVFASDMYLKSLADLTGLDEPAETRGRSFSAWFNSAIKRMPEFIGLIRTLKRQKVWKIARRIAAKEKERIATQAYIPSKRLKGVLRNDLEEENGDTSRSTQTKSTPEESNLLYRYSSAVDDHCGWNDLQGAPLHIYHFNRVIVDEFAELDERKDSSLFTMICGLKADKRWGLSATPSLNDFVDVNRIARLIGINLGADDSNPLVICGRNLRYLRSELTKAEIFQAYNENHTFEWYRYRHELAQTFLDHFARQSKADIGNVSCEEELKPVVLHQSQRVFYQELHQYFVSNGMKMVKQVDVSNDKSYRIENITNSCDLPEKALMQCNTVHSPLIQKDFKNRLKQYKALVASMKSLLSEAITLRAACDTNDVPQVYESWKAEAIGDTDTERLRDPDVINELQKMVDEILPNGAVIPSDVARRKLIEKTTRLRDIHQKLTSARWSWRFAATLCFCGDSAVNSEILADVAPCAAKDCATSRNGTGSIIQSLCGHLICQKCLDDRSVEAQGRCPVHLCNASSLEFQHVKLRKVPELPGDAYGAKLDIIVTLVRDEIPDEDKVLVFVQDNEILKTLREALRSANISSYKADSSTIEAFKEGRLEPKELRPRKVLVLNVSEESAAGIDLTVANHVIFPSPFLAESQQKYCAAMKQMIGRAFRSGQKKLVRVYRCVALDTVDVDLLELRERRSTPLYAGIAIGLVTDGPEQDKQMTRLGEDNEGRIALFPITMMEPGSNAKPVEHLRLPKFSDVISEG